MNPLDDDLIEDYLDHALLRLVGLAPYRHRTEMREELREHVRSLMEDGKSECEALYELGDPTDLGERLLLEWEQKAAPAPSARFSRSGFALAVVLLGLPFAMVLHLIEEARLLPDSVGYLGLANEIFLITPFVFGAVLGCARPGHAARNAAAVSLLLAAYGVVCGLTAGPREELLDLAFRTLVSWTLPAVLCAYLSAAFCRRQRRRRLWRTLRMEFARASGPDSHPHGGNENETSLFAH